MKYGVVVIVAALMATILLGSISIDQESIASTRYDRIAGLEPIVEYTAIDDVIQYNPAQNVTGWQGATYTYQLAPSIYPVTLYSTTTSGNAGPIEIYGGNFFPYDNAAYGYENSESWYVVWNDSTRPSNGSFPSQPGWEERELMIGGYSASDSFSSGLMYREAVATVQVIKADGTTATATDSSPLWWLPLDVIAYYEDWPSGVVITITSSISVLEDISVDGRYLQPITKPGYNNSARSWATQTLTLGTTSAASYWWDSAKQCFYPIVGTDPQGNPIYSGVTTQLVWWGSDNTVYLPYTVYEPGTTKYVKPYTDVGIPAGKSATWSNGYDNHQVQLIVDPSAQISINDTSEYTYWQVALPAAAASYDKVLVTLGPEPYWQGITSYTSPVQYEIIPYRYPLTYDTVIPITLYYTGASTMTNYGVPVGQHVQIKIMSSSSEDQVTVYDPNTSSTTQIWPGTGTYDAGPTGTYTVTWSVSPNPLDAALYNIRFEPDAVIEWSELDAIQSITVKDTSTAAIVNTWVPADPLGNLWGNPALSPYQYFPDLYTGAGVRIIISSVLTTGASLTIGGTEYATEDGRILLGSSWQDLAGLAIDYSGDSSITITAANGTAYDGGTWDLTDIRTTEIRGAGSWYFVPSIYEAVLTSEDVSILNFAQSSTAEWLGFAFCGLLVAGAVGVVAARREVDFWDWVIIGGAAIVALVVIM